ncbi:unnamed protein product, partial [Nesidiocoris tenuis]
AKLPPATTRIRHYDAALRERPRSTSNYIGPEEHGIHQVGVSGHNIRRYSRDDDETSTAGGLVDVGYWQPRTGPVLSDHLFPNVMGGFRGRRMPISTVHNLGIKLWTKMTMLWPLGVVKMMYDFRCLRGISSKPLLEGGRSSPGQLQHVNASSPYNGPQRGDEEVLDERIGLAIASNSPYLKIINKQ